MQAFRAAVEARDMDAAVALLSDRVVFHSPIVFTPYQVNDELMSRAAAGAMFMHCLPAHRGEEVTAEVIESDVSAVFDQAENRLHTQKALLLMLLGT